jgi:predicted O-methyltransferase YrrM
MANGADRIWEMARGFQPSRVLLTAIEYDVFDLLDNGPATSSQMAARMKTDTRATDRLMNALVALGLLEKDGDEFSNSKDAQEFLVTGQPGYMGGALMHASNMWNSWSTLTKAVEEGHSVLKRTDEEHLDWLTPFIAAMHYNSSAKAPSVIGLIDIRDVKQVLDVGGGSGAYSIAFCRADPEIETTVLDLPNVIPLTQKYIEDAEMTHRIKTVRGDYHCDDLGEEFDLVFLSAVIHSNSPEENAALMSKCRKSLKPCGQIVIQDFIVDPTRTSPPHAALFALNMLVATDAGDTYTEAEVRGWLETAGFRDVKRVDAPEAGTSLITARA